MKNNADYQADQAAINFNDPFVLTGEEALAWLADCMVVANENAEMLK